MRMCSHVNTGMRVSTGLHARTDTGPHSCKHDTHTHTPTTCMHSSTNINKYPPFPPLNARQSGIRGTYMQTRTRRSGSPPFPFVA